MEDFDKWLSEFNEHYENSNSWQIIQPYSTNVKDLLGLYIQYKSHKQTGSLVWATWVLAAFTIILASATIWLAYKA